MFHSNRLTCCQHSEDSFLGQFFKILKREDSKGSSCTYTAPSVVRAQNELHTYGRRTYYTGTLSRQSIDTVTFVGNDGGLSFE